MRSLASYLRRFRVRWRAHPHLRPVPYRRCDCSQRRPPPKVVLHRPLSTVCKNSLTASKHPANRLIEEPQDPRQSCVIRKQQPRQKENNKDYDQRRSKHFASVGPGNLIHFPFDGNQKISKRRHLHDAEARPQSNCQQHERSPNPQHGILIAVVLVQTPAPQRHDQDERSERNLPRNASLIALVKSEPKKFLPHCFHGLTFYSIK